VARDALPDAELLAYSGQHVAYEIRMLRATAVRLDSPGIDAEVRKALVQSCGIHLRALTAFLYDDAPRPDDVVAGGFFDDRSSWASVRPEKSEALRDAQERANKEFAHLTAKRKGPADATKAWSFATLVPELLDVLRVFVEHASHVKLHEEVHVAVW
jgi:hypothetical protein